MIRPFTQQDMDQLLEVWILSSLEANDFIPASFWWLQQDKMQQQYLHSAEIWVAEQDDQLQGFMALVGDSLIALFIRPQEQGKGIGCRLLNLAKTLRSTLRLRLFAENQSAVRFCERQGFSIQQVIEDQASQRTELLMVYGHQPEAAAS